MIEQKKLLRKILLFSCLTLVGIIGVFTYLFLNPPVEDPGCATVESTPFFCGTQKPSDEALVGKPLFNSNCAACHKRFMLNDVLLEGMKKFPTDKDFHNFIQHEDSLSKNKKGIKDVTNELYEGDFNHRFKLTEADAKAIRAYIIL